MGCSPSKSEKNEALALCRLRTRFVKQAVDARFGLSAAHLAYIQSLRSVGIALRRFAEAEVPVESSLSTSEPDKSPSHSSYASPSPSPLVDTGCSPLHNESPFSPSLHNISYARTTGSAAVAVTVDLCSNHVAEEEESISFPLPPPPLPRTASWDFFDPVASIEHAAGFRSSHQFYSPGDSVGGRPLKADVGGLDDEEADSAEYGLNRKATEFSFRRDKSNVQAALSDSYSEACGTIDKSLAAKKAVDSDENVLKSDNNNLNGIAQNLCNGASPELNGTKRGNVDQVKEPFSEREDASEFITHRAKDFLSSVKDIEYRFNKSAEYGSEVSRMLEANKVRLSSSYQKKGNSSPSVVVTALQLACCKRTALGDEPVQHMPKVITWNRSTSSLSSSSKNPLTAATKDDTGDSGSDFIDEFCMLSGSHASTLDRLYAWERKLYDEVKASQSIRKEYDQKCTQLQHEFAKDLNARLIDKTRALVKDLHSRVRVTIQAVDSISKRIEKLRDEELQPQLMELIQGLGRMWKSMLECHHAQYITISLAYHMKNSITASQSEPYRQAVVHLKNELDFFQTSFVNLINTQQAYVEALSAWLQNCIQLPQERPRGRRTAVFSPRRALAPPIFVLCRDWLAAIKSLPSEDLSKAIASVVSASHNFLDQQIEDKGKEANNTGEHENEEQPQGKEAENHERTSSLGTLQPNLTRMFDLLSKFAEASLKAYDDVKQGSEVARISYANGRIRFLM